MDVAVDENVIASDRTNSKLNFEVPANKEKLLEKLKPLTYKKRIETVSRLGRDHSKNPQPIVKLIGELKKHPNLPNPSISAADDFTDLLPAQELNVEKHFTEEQLAVFMASSLGEISLPFLQKELESNSFLMKKKAIKEFIRLQKDDQKVFEASKNTVHKVRMGIIKEAIQQKRRGLVDMFYNDLKETKPEIVRVFLYGCTHSLVKSELLRDRNLGQNKKKLIKNHPDTILEVLHKELEDTPILNRSTVWSFWAPFAGYTELKYEEKLLKLALRFPTVRWVGTSKYEGSQEIDTANMVVDIPSELFGKLSRFILHFPGPIYDFWNIYGVSQKRELIPSLLSTAVHRLDRYVDLLNHGVSFTTYDSKEHWKETVTTSLIRISSSVIDRPFLDKTHENVKKYLDFVVKVLTRPRSEFWHTQADWSNSVHGAFQGLSSDPTQFAGDIVDAFIRIFKTSGTPDKLAKSSFIFNPNMVANVFSDFKSGHGMERLWDECITSPNMNHIGIFTSGNSLPSHYTTFLSITSKILRDKNTKEKRRNQILSFRRKIFSHLLKQIEEDKVEVPPTEAKYQYSSNLFLSERIRLFKMGKLDEKIVTDTQNFGSSELVTLFESLLTSLKDLQQGKWVEIDPEFNAKEAYDYVQKVLRAVLSSSLTPKTKEVLFRFKDVQLEDNWKTMTKEAASAHRNEREINIKRLIDATHLTRNPQKLADLLQFVWGRIKNEVEETKEMHFRNMFSLDKWALESPEVRNAYLDLFRQFLSTKSCEISEEMKESFTPGKSSNIPSLYESESMLSFFQELGEKVFYLSLDPTVSKEESESRFEFGSTIQLELFQYYVGPSLSSLHFQFNLDSSKISNNAYPQSMNDNENEYNQGGRKPRRPREPRSPWGGKTFTRKQNKTKKEQPAKFNEKLLWFIEKISQVYSSQLDPEVFKTARGYNYLIKDFIRALGESWSKSQKIVEHIGKMINETCMAAQRDDEGALILELEDPLLELFSSLRAASTFSDNFCLEPFLQLAKTLLRSHSCDLVVFAFYSYYRNHREGTISPDSFDRKPDSTRFLIESSVERMRAKDRVIRFLLKVSPSAIRVKLVWRHLVSVRQDLLNPYLGAKKSFRGMFFKLGSNPSSSPARGGRRGRGPRSGPKTVQQTIEEEKNKEIALQKYFKDKPDKKDHPDLFIIPATYGLQKLNQDQSKVLATDHHDRMENFDLPSGNRIKSVKSWTIVPTTNYPDIVSYLNDVVEGKPEKEFPIPLVKTFYTGLLRGDDPIAPIHFLLSPTTLAKKDYAQISIYSLSKCIGLTRTETFVGLLKVLLDAKRRKEYNVSIHKQVVRLIGSKPSDESLRLLMAELGRKELHRDVRIAASTMLTQFLILPGLKDQAWKSILESSKRINVDELIVLLAAEPIEDRPPPNLLHRSDLLLTPQLQEQWASLKGQMKIPSEFCSKFAKEIVVPLNKIEKVKQTEKLEDLKLIAAFASWNWANYLDHEEIATKMDEILKRKGEKDLEPYLNGMEHFNSQFFTAADILVQLCTTQKEFNGEADKKHIFEVIETICTAISEGKDQITRELHLSHLEYLLSLLSSSRFTWEDEQIATAPIKRLGILTKLLFTREIFYLKDDLESGKELCLRSIELQSAYSSMESVLGQILSRLSSYNQFKLVEYLLAHKCSSRRLQVNHDTVVLNFIQDRSSFIRDDTKSVLNFLERIATNFYFSEAVTTDAVVAVMKNHRKYTVKSERHPDAIFTFVLNKIGEDFEAPFYSDWMRGYIPSIENYGTQEEIVKLFEVLVNYQFKNRRNIQNENNISDYLKYILRNSTRPLALKLVNRLLSGEMIKEGGGHSQIHFLLEQAGNLIRLIGQATQGDLQLLTGYIYECSLYIVGVGKSWGDAASAELSKVVSSFPNPLDKHQMAELALSLLNRKGVDQYPYKLISNVFSQQEIQEFANDKQFHSMCASFCSQIFSKCSGAWVPTKGNATPPVNPVNKHIAPEFEPVLLAMLSCSDPFVKEFALKY